MFQTILVPTDGSPLAEKAALAAIELAGRINGTVVAISVAEPYPYSPLSEGTSAIASREYEEKSLETAQANVDRVRQLAKEHNVPAEAVLAQSYDPYKEIVDTANKRHCDAIFMASHGRKGLSKLFLGSQTQKVLAHTNVPVTVFH